MNPIDLTILTRQIQHFHRNKQVVTLTSGWNSGIMVLLFTYTKTSKVPECTRKDGLVMEKVILKAEVRPLRAKSYLKRLRKDGKVPAVLHNRGDESMHVVVDALEFKKALSTPAGMNVMLDLDVEGKGKFLSRTESIQYDILREGVYTHIEFGQISLDQEIESNVPVIVIGFDKREADDGVLSQSMHEIIIKSTPDKIPASIHADVSKMKIGDVLIVGDLDLPKGCVAVSEAEEAVVSIAPPRVAEAESPEAADDSPLAHMASGPEPELVE